MEIEPTTILRGAPDLYSEKYEQARCARLGNIGVVHWTIRLNKERDLVLFEGYESQEKVLDRLLERLPGILAELHRRRLLVFPVGLHFTDVFGRIAPYVFSCEEACVVLHGIIEFNRNNPARKRELSELTVYLRPEPDEKRNRPPTVVIDISHNVDEFADNESSIQNSCHISKELAAEHTFFSSPYPTAFYRVFVHSLFQDRQLCYQVRDADKAMIGVITSAHDLYYLWRSGEYELECGTTKTRVLATHGKLAKKLFEFLSREWQTKCELDSVILSRVRQFDDEETGAKKGDLIPLVKIRVKLRWFDPTSFQLFGLDEEGNRVALGDSEVHITGRN